MTISEQLSSDMNKFDPVQEQANILKILSDDSELHLREIHQQLVDMDASAFTYSPEPGNTWNDERHILRALRDILKNKDGAVTNEQRGHSQTWSLTEQGERLVDSSNQV